MIRISTYIMLFIQVLSISGISLDWDSCCKRVSDIDIIELAGDRSDEVKNCCQTSCESACCSSKTEKGCKTERIDISAPVQPFVLATQEVMTSAQEMELCYGVQTQPVTLGEPSPSFTEPSLHPSVPIPIRLQRLTTYG